METQKNIGDIIIPVVVPATDLWSNVMGSGWEYMSWWIGIKYSDGASWDSVGTFVLTCDDPENEGKKVSKTIGIDDLARGYGLAVSEGFRHCGYPIDLENMDSCSSDAVLQYAFFGKLIYG